MAVVAGPVPTSFAFRSVGLPFIVNLLYKGYYRARDEKILGEKPPVDVGEISGEKEVTSGPDRDCQIKSSRQLEWAYRSPSLGMFEKRGERRILKRF